MKKVKKALLLVMFIAVCAVLYFKVFSSNKGTKVIEWDNIYNESNLTFFYEDKDSINESTKLKNLNETYNVSGLIEDEVTELKKVIKTTEILNTILEYDDVKDSYDVIISNPPIRAGKSVYLRIIEEAFNHLNNDGQLWFVMRTNHGVKTVIKNLKAKYNVDVLAKDNGFYVVKVYNL